MAKLKKVVIKIHDDGAVEIISQDPGVAIVLQYPDGREAEVHQGDKKTWKGGNENGGRLKGF
jgi:hypothetical protein